MKRAGATSRWGVIAIEACLTLLVSTSALAEGIYINGNVDCAEWVKARSQNRADYFEHYLIGLMNGLAMGSEREFWQANGQKLSRDAVYLWMDKYCRDNPLNDLMAGSYALFRERNPSFKPSR